MPAFIEAKAEGYFTVISQRGRTFSLRVGKLCDSVSSINMKRGVMFCSCHDQTTYIWIISGITAYLTDMRAVQSK